jgi:hypothetical protein
VRVDLEKGEFRVEQVEPAGKKEERREERHSAHEQAPPPVH